MTLVDEIDPSPPRIRFHGEDYVFVGRDDRSSGAIATPTQYSYFQESHAHLFEDGFVRRHGAVIGRRDEIEWLEEED